MNTMVGLFDGMEQAEQFIRDLVGASISRDAISVVAPTHANRSETNESLDGALGLMDNVQVHTVLGVGNVVAAGPLASALDNSVSATTRGLLAGLQDMGVPEHQAHAFAEGVRRGSSLVAVQAENLPVAMVQDFLASNQAVDMDSRGASWREQGWERFDPHAAPIPADGSAAQPDMVDESELAAKQQVGPSIGAITSGLVPGGYGAAGDAVFGRDEEGKG